MSKLSPSELAARIVTEGALPSITQTVRGQLPIEPVVLTDSEAAQLGLAEGGTTLLYRLGDTNVFFDMAVSRMIVWFSGGDAHKALATLEGALKRTYPQAKQAADEAHPNESGMRMRSFDVKLADGQAAIVEASYPEPNQRPGRFAVQVTAMAIKN